ncbi:MAG: HAD-IA family hydrolase [Hyphomicrobiales bacterium]|nr:HAD-IA family hydrolase [Hyphomicrobiales bacterium]MDE2018061.1 HAD-IA family hydrolase [Hyphomicrobiales bacterium]
MNAHVVPTRRAKSLLRPAAILFDVDGTLAETEETHRLSFNRAFAEAGLDWRWSAHEYSDLLRVTGGKERIGHYVARHGLPARFAAPAFVKALHVRKTALYGELVRSGAAPLRPGVAELLAEAREAGVRLAIATTTSPDNVDALLTAALGPTWRDAFPVVAAGDMAPRKKPAPDVYLLALKALDLPARACVAVEDSRNGVLAAVAAGLSTYAVRSRYAADDDLSEAEFVVASPADLRLDALRAAVAG